MFNYQYLPVLLLFVGALGYLINGWRSTAICIVVTLVFWFAFKFAV